MILDALIIKILNRSHTSVNVIFNSKCLYLSRLFLTLYLSLTAVKSWNAFDFYCCYQCWGARWKISGPHPIYCQGTPFVNREYPYLQFVNALQSSFNVEVRIQGRRVPSRAPGQLVDAGPLPDTGTKNAQLGKFSEFQNMKMVDLFVKIWDESATQCLSWLISSLKGT